MVKQEGSGCALMCRKANTIFISNMTNAIDEYQLPTVHRISSFTYAIVKNYMFQLALFQTPTREYIITGGDSGFARVFDRHSRHLIDTLSHRGKSILSFQAQSMYIYTSIPALFMS